MTASTEIVTNVAMQPHDLSIIGLISDADIVVKLVLLILLLASVWSWAIIVDKSLLLRQVLNQIQRFEKIFWSGQRLDQLYEKLRNRENNSLAVVFVKAMDEWNKQQIASKGQKTISYLNIGIKERILQAMEVAKNNEIDKLSKNLSFLAIVGSSATFIGLFGTVWGILMSFKAIAVMKNASISVVAPGIAEALFATAIGLVAAIPAMIFYSLIANKINYISNKIENFASELSSLLFQEIDRGLNHGNDEYK
jgi:biopolymer transport protein TolQ